MTGLSNLTNVNVEEDTGGDIEDTGGVTVVVENGNGDGDVENGNGNENDNQDILSELQSEIASLTEQITNLSNQNQDISSELQVLISSLQGQITNLSNQTDAVANEITDIPEQAPTPELLNSTINLHILSYDENGKLVSPKNPSIDVTHPLKTNLRNYLGQFKLLTDVINILDGKVINFGVEFEVVAQRGVNKADVKLRVIDTIRNYFTTDKMQFRQPLYTNDVIYEVMGVEGVRSVNKLELVQRFNDGTDDVLYYFTSDKQDGDDEGGDSRYNWLYDFGTFYGRDPDEADNTINAVGSEGVILPSKEPSVFELKFPNRDIRGKVL